MVELGDHCWVAPVGPDEVSALRAAEAARSAGAHADAEEHLRRAPERVRAHRPDSRADTAWSTAGSSSPGGTPSSSPAGVYPPSRGGALAG